MLKKSLYILILILLIACDSEDNGITASEFQTPVITGYYRVNEAGVNLGKIGAPNDVSSIEFDSINANLICAPIPSRYTMAVYLSIRNTNGKYDEINDAVATVWLQKATYGASESEVLLENNSTLTVVNPKIVVANHFAFKGNNIEIIVNANLLASGYYRLYALVNNHLLYRNIVIE